MTRYINRDDFEDAAYQIDADIRDDYSGRGMYGDTCIGVTFDQYGGNEMELGVLLGQKLDADDAYALARNARSDSMGLGTIIYFPNFKFEDEEDED